MPNINSEVMQARTCRNMSYNKRQIHNVVEHNARNEQQCGEYDGKTVKLSEQK